MGVYINGEKIGEMTDFDRIRNIIIDYEDEKMTMEEALDEICGVCFARGIRIWDAAGEEING